MPIIESAKKRVRTAEKRKIRNKKNKLELKTVIKDFIKCVEDGNTTDAKEKLQHSIKTIDKAANKGIIHKNNAANKKSRLTKMYNSMA